jgi:hypothetical protein
MSEKTRFWILLALLVVSIALLLAANTLASHVSIG